MRRRTAQRPSSSRAERIGDGERRVTARRLQSPTETIVDRETSGGSVRERVEVQRSESARHFHGPADEYLTLAQLEAYSKISGRQLRNYLALPPGQALPCYRPGRKVLVRRSEFDIWVTRFRQRGSLCLPASSASSASTRSVCRTRDCHERCAALSKARRPNDPPPRVWCS